MSEGAKIGNVSVDVQKLQAILPTAPEVRGKIGALTWQALGCPSGWDVWYNNDWWDAESLSEEMERHNGQLPG